MRRAPSPVAQVYPSQSLNFNSSEAAMEFVTGRYRYSFPMSHG